MNYLVIGAGSWGTAFANVLAENGHPTCLWTREASVYHEINSEKRNSRYLPGVRLHSDLGIVDNLDQALERKPDVVVFAIPSHALAEFGRENKALFADKLRGDAVLLSLTKGIENDTLLRVDEILQRDFNRSDTRFAALSGPSHAEEVARKMPTAVVCAAYDHNLAAKLQEELSNAYFRVYSSTDVAGVEIGGSIKNVFAIAAGILDGAELGDNTKAALMTRALVEMERLGQALGARAETFAGLSGVGDLIVTCTSKHSRNRFVGEQLGKGIAIDEIIANMVQVAEGVKTTKSVWQLGRKYRLELPISEKVYEVLYSGKDARMGIRELMLRDLKAER